MRELSEYLDDTIAYDHRHIYPSGNNDFDSSGRNSGGGADSSVSGLTVVQYYTQLMACMGGKRVIFKIYFEVGWRLGIGFGLGLFLLILLLFYYYYYYYY